MALAEYATRLAADDRGCFASCCSRPSPYGSAISGTTRCTFWSRSVRSSSGSVSGRSPRTVRGATRIDEAHAREHLPPCRTPGRSMRSRSGRVSPLGGRGSHEGARTWKPSLTPLAVDPPAVHLPAADGGRGAPRRAPPAHRAPEPDGGHPGARGVRTVPVDPRGGAPIRRREGGGVSKDRVIGPTGPMTIGALLGSSRRTRRARPRSPTGCRRRTARPSSSCASTGRGRRR